MKMQHWLVLLAAMFILMWGAAGALAENVDEMTLEELEAYIASLQQLAEEKDADEKGAIELTTEINGMTYTGTYTGDVAEGVPHGEGIFEGETDGKKLRYEGHWEKGAVKGEGKVEAEAFFAHFPDPEESFDQEGFYTGATVDGKPEGEGIFESENAAGVEWVYSGEWKAGSFHGEGMLEWLDEDGICYIGTFTQGEFTPTWRELVLNLGLLGKIRYDVSESAMEFMEKYSKHFLDASRYDIATSTALNFTFDFSRFKKNPMGERAGLIRVYDAEIVQVFTESLWDVEYEYMLFQTDDGTIYHGIRQGTSDIVENMKVDMYYLPLDWVTYETVEGKSLWSVFGVISSYIEESYDTLKQGSSGSDVLKMKYRLQELGYFTAGASLSDSYNAVCKERVMQFQEANGLSVTGIADSDTLRLLYSDEAKAKP